MKPFSLSGFTTNASVISVYDGDSITAAFPIPQFVESEKYLWKCRVIGIDTPELRSKNWDVREHAFKARDRVRGLLVGRSCRLRLGEFDKYGRVLVSVQLADGRDLGRLLIDEGLALPYDGGRRPDWGARLTKDDRLRDE